MTRRLLAPAATAAGLAALVLGASCAAPSTSLDAEPLCVMTFNVRYANPGDGANAWDRRTDLVFGVIRDRAPDVVGLQEALPEQMDALRAAFPDYAFVGQGRDGGSDGEHSALMIRAERLALVEHGDFWLSPTPDVVASRGWDAALPRMCTWAVLRDRTSGAELLAMNTHFDHRGAEAREQSARVIVARAAERADLPLVLTGDLNAGESSAPLDVLRAAGLRDTFRDLHPSAEDVGTFHGFRGGTGGAKIDYVLVDGRWSTRSAEIVRDHDGARHPSDHTPVVAVIGLDQ